MPLAAPSLTAAEYLRMAQELETMAAELAQDLNVDHHFAERLIVLSRQMREDGARLAPKTNGSGASRMPFPERLEASK